MEAPRVHFHTPGVNSVVNVDENCLCLFCLCAFSMIPELNVIYFSINKDPAPGPTGGLPPQGKDLTPALAPRLPPREARSGAALDPLPLVIAKKGARDHGHPKGLGLCRIRMAVLKCVMVYCSYPRTEIHWETIESEQLFS